MQLTTAQVQAALDEAITSAQGASTGHPLLGYIFSGLKLAIDNTSLVSYLTTAINGVLAKIP